MAVLRIPYKDRSQPLADPDVLRLPEALEDRAERVTVDRLLVEAMGDPDLHTVGDFLDRMEQASPQERRRLIDEARQAAGLKTFTASEWEAERERGRRAAAAIPRRDGDGRIEASCSHPGCNNFEPDPVTGLVAMLPVRKWWCPQHRSDHESDLQPWTPGLRVSEVGLVVDADDDIDAERERERSEREQERQRQRREQSQAERRVIAAERREYEKARAEQHRRETPEGFPT
jgi:hypothetical protein